MVRFDAKLGPVLGKASADKLAAGLGIHTVADLLRHYPRRYIDLATPESFAELEPGQHVTIVAEVISVKKIPFRNQPRRFRTQVVFTDGATELEAVFFNQHWVDRAVSVGSQQLLSGEVSFYGGKPQLTHPTMAELPAGKSLSETRLGRPIIPVYPATGKIPSWRIEESIDHVRFLVEDYPEPINAEILAQLNLPDAAQAFEWIHKPATADQWRSARDRFRFEEAFAIQAVFAARQAARGESAATSRAQRDDGLRAKLLERLPFELTAGQQRVAAEIAADLAGTTPMHRLLQGDVGSGKTLVALLAMLQVVDAGGQAAMLAPTEVLAAQHGASITKLLGDLAEAGMLSGADEATRVTVLTGSMPTAARRQAMLDIASGTAGIVIGTHAILAEKVSFAELGMVVIDEQHRFGVEQRAVLVDRAEKSPHVLVMTATPIPRTVAMTVFGDLEVSTLDELPAGRQPIQTTIVPVAQRPAWLDRAWQRVREEAAKGRQTYVVVSRIGDEKSDDAVTTSLLELHDQLASGPLAGLSMGILHGRMHPEEKDAHMAAFTRGETAVLVATTVIEVGVDVPNASMMVIMDADRFGISQLHQLRGRVGRGSLPGLCLLVTSAEPESDAMTRLEAVASTTDGFELSRRDVELRHEGDVLGARQSGVRSSLKLLSVVRDGEVIERARDVARTVIEAGDVNEDLRRAMTLLEQSEQADFLERA